ncbi:hypothetical protein LJC72_11595 [Bacteroides sp. OttesenSCG-928-D19]|nr:hypothetical protein [Bacteroides sp. OttesenSCG-928-D19]
MAERKLITIYHLHFKDVRADDNGKQDYYFGSISAIYDCFDSLQIGIKASSLYNFNLDEHTNPLYENKKCIIRKSTLITKSKQK